MKKIYVAHPFQGKRENMQAITHICQRLVRFGVMPISPVHSFSFLSDKVPEDREKALEFCEKLLGSADEIWFFGACVNSEGCKRECKAAIMKSMFIRVVTGWGADDNPIFADGAPGWLRI